MSAEVLREAAALMRELADKAARQPVVKANVQGVWLGSRFYMVTTPDREYALADWLDGEAESFDTTELWFHPDDGASIQEDKDFMFAGALAVARAYLNTP